MSKVFTGEDPIALERMMVVLVYLQMTNGFEPLTLEAIKVVNWLASNELSRRLFPRPA